MGLICYQVRHGYLYHFDKDNTIGASLAHYGEWAEAEIYLLSKILQKGDVVLDIGWNLPQDAYKDLEQTKKQLLITDNNYVPSEQLEKLQREYNDLREDRIKAQEIMENQAREIARLNSLVNKL